MSDQRSAPTDPRIAQLERSLDVLVARDRRMADFLAIARLGTWELDLDTDEAIWSAETRVLLGVTSDAPAVPDTVLGACADDRDRDTIRAALADVRAGSRRYDVTYRVAWRDGSLHTLRSRGDVRVDALGKPRRIVGVVQDVTEEELLRAQLTWSQKLETVGQLAAGLAHDLNNMLTVIQSACGFVAEALQDHPARHDLATIQEAAERAAGLTHGLLAFSRQQVLRPERTDVNQVVGGLRKMLTRAVGEGISLDLRTPQALGTVFVDPQQLAQVLVNLAVNARDAMPEGGRLTIETDEAELPPDLPGERVPHVRLRVRDTGVGMDAATLSRIFEPFFTTKGSLGTGLGLSMVFGIVTQSGGHIRADSRPGHGTTFEVYLPIGDRAPVRRPPPARMSAPSGDGAVVLVVEDDPAVRRMIVRILERAGYRVHEAADGVDAGTVHARLERLDLLVTDVMLPGTSGREVADALTAARPSLRVLFVSGYAGDPRVEERGPRPGDAFLPKPFTTEDLVREVGALLVR